MNDRSCNQIILDIIKTNDPRHIDELRELISCNKSIRLHEAQSTLELLVYCINELNDKAIEFNKSIDAAY